MVMLVGLAYPAETSLAWTSGDFSRIQNSQIVKSMLLVFFVY